MDMVASEALAVVQRVDMMQLGPDFEADTFRDASIYFAWRDLSLASHGWRLRGIDPLDEWGALARFEKANEKRFAVYVFASHRGEGRLSEFLTNNPIMKFITVADCNVETYYKNRGRDILVLPLPQATGESSERMA